MGADGWEGTAMLAGSASDANAAGPRWVPSFVPPAPVERLPSGRNGAHGELGLLSGGALLLARSNGPKNPPPPRGSFSPLPAERDG